MLINQSKKQKHCRTSGRKHILVIFFKGGQLAAHCLVAVLDSGVRRQQPCRLILQVLNTGMETIFDLVN